VPTTAAATRPAPAARRLPRPSELGPCPAYEEELDGGRAVSEHKRILAQQGYRLECPKNGFLDAELKMIGEFGNWMDALCAGRIAPLSPRQEDFIRAVRGECEPTSIFEFLWRKVTDRQVKWREKLRLDHETAVREREERELRERQEESLRHRKSAYQSPIDDFGIPEWTD
jgi:uncharacterized protein YifE (UPF0438 family)